MHIQSALISDIKTIKDFILFNFNKEQRKFLIKKTADCQKTAVLFIKKTIYTESKNALEKTTAEFKSIAGLFHLTKMTI